MTLEVRRARPGDDLAAAGRIVQLAYFGLPGYPHDEEYDITIGEVADRATDTTTSVVVGLLDGRLVGCLTYVDHPDNPHHEFDDAEAATFRFFGVDPSVLGRGVGEAMVQWCIHEAAAAGKARLRIHTLESMQGAQRLYHKMGFQRDPAGDEEWDGVLGLAFVYEL